MTFYFNGKPVEAQEGDTIASALYRSGRRIFTRSFKYHRPRGLLCMNGKCPNCLVNADGAPNVRACVTPVREGMQAHHQNAWPSLEQDYLSVAQRFDWMMPVGWYYKVFTNPKLWHAAEPYIRRVAGLGDVPQPGAADREYEHAYMQADVAVIGGGPAGIEAALEAASPSRQTILIDDQPALGGHLRYSRNAQAVLAELLVRLLEAPVQVIRPAYCFGLYEGGLLGVLQSNPHAGAVERLIHLRAKRVVVATGAYESPLTFEKNDLVGVMLSTAVQRLIHVHGIAPGKRAVIVGEGARAVEVAEDLKGVGVTVAATVPAQSVIGAQGSRNVTGVRIKDKQIACDLIVVCGHMIPDAGLIAQARGRVEWNAEQGAFTPTDMPAHISAVGEVTGTGLTPTTPLPPPDVTFNKRTFVCFCNDVTTQDLKDSIKEGFDHIETLKRYTTTSMGPCQGRMCQLPAIGICAHETGRTMDQTGTTTSRPPNPSVTLGALAGPKHHPVRRTPMHYEQEALGAVWLDMGEWKRPRYFKATGCLTEKACVEEEYRAVRERAGLIDVSTLGKLDVKGTDTGKLLDKVYTGRFSDQRPGSVRYSALCDEAGVMLDDGVIARLAENHWFITTTTGNLDFVQQWLEWWLAGSGWDVHVTNITPGMASMNLAGPKARDVLRKLTDCDLDTKAFPYMRCRQAQVAGAPAIMLRIGFVGETGWEIHVPAESGGHVWDALLEAGAEYGIRAFGVEAQRLLRLEKRHVIIGVDTDALTNPFEAGMAWIAKFDKPDFIGKAALQRLEKKGQKQSLVGFIMLENELPEDGAPVLIDGKLSGRVTSARFSPLTRKPIGLAWAPLSAAHEGAEISIRINGRPTPARVTHQAFYDPEGARLRM